MAMTFATGVLASALLGWPSAAVVQLRRVGSAAA